MKSAREFIAILVIAFITLLACVAGGQQQPQSASSASSIVPPSSALPDSLPIGSRQYFLDNIATNGVSWLRFGLDYTNILGNMVRSSVNQFQTNFNSYAEFEDCVRVYGESGWKHLLSQTGNAAVSPNSTISFWGGLSHDFPNGKGETFIGISTNIGCLSQVSSSSFVNVAHNYTEAVIPVSGLQCFSVEVGNHEYCWIQTNGTAYNVYPTKFPFQPKAQRILPNEVALEEWYSCGDYRLRATIGNGSELRTYTQAGRYLQEAVLEYMTPEKLVVHFTPGADVSVESSADRVHWTEIASFDWSLNTDSAIVEISVNKEEPQRFYRAKTW